MSEPPFYKVEIEAAALADLRAIALHMADNSSSNVADEFVAKIIGRINLLETFPLRGSQPKELGNHNPDHYLQIVSGQHRIFYRVRGRVVIISLIVDGRRDLQAILGARLLDDQTT